MHYRYDIVTAVSQYQQSQLRKLEIKSAPVMTILLGFFLSRTTVAFFAKMKEYDAKKCELLFVASQTIV